jgi:hypothetical protein
MNSTRVRPAIGGRVYEVQLASLAAQLQVRMRDGAPLGRGGPRWHWAVASETRFRTYGFATNTSTGSYAKSECTANTAEHYFGRFA